MCTGNRNKGMEFDFKSECKLSDPIIARIGYLPIRDQKDDKGCRKILVENLVQTYWIGWTL